MIDALFKQPIIKARNEIPISGPLGPVRDSAVKSL